MSGFYSSGEYTVAAANTTRFASNATGATWTLAETTTGDNLAHLVTIKGDAATNHSAKTAVITGTDANGGALTETVNLPNGTATVTSTKHFLTVTSIVPSATIGADTMDLGIAAAARSPWIAIDALCPEIPSFNAAVTMSGTLDYDFLATIDTTPDGDSNVYVLKNSTASALLSVALGTSAAVLLGPITAVCVDVNSHTSGVFTFEVLSRGRRPAVAIS
jgi:hypothetical protein